MIRLSISLLIYNADCLINLDLGSELLYEQRFATQTKDSKTSSDRAKCVKYSAKASVSVKIWGAYMETGGEGQNDACKSSSEDEAYEMESSSEMTRMISRGSKPKSLDEWVDSNFTPIVILAELDDITNLFKDAWLTESQAYGFKTTVNGTEIKEFFISMMQLFCGLVLPGLPDDECNGKY